MHHLYGADVYYGRFVNDLDQIIVASLHFFPLRIITYFLILATSCFLQNFACLIFRRFLGWVIRWEDWGYTLSRQRAFDATYIIFMAVLFVAAVAIMILMR